MCIRDRYQDGQEKPRVNAEESAEQFDHAAIEATRIKEEDTTLEKAVKKINELKLTFFPFLIVAPLNILTGTSKAFSFVFFFFILIVLAVVNLGKFHRNCCENKCINVVL